MALALCLVLAGCGGGGHEPKKTASPTKKTAVTTPAPSAKPTVTAPTGVPAPEDLSDFQCFANDKGVWNASGLLENTSKKSVSYQVTVFVGKDNGKDAKAKTKQYAYIRASTSIRVAITKIPAAEDATQCFVQVLAK